MTQDTEALLEEFARLKQLEQSLQDLLGQLQIANDAMRAIHTRETRVRMTRIQIGNVAGIAFLAARNVETGLETLIENIKGEQQRLKESAKESRNAGKKSNSPQLGTGSEPVFHTRHATG